MSSRRYKVAQTVYLQTQILDKDVSAAEIKLVALTERLQDAELKIRDAVSEAVCCPGAARDSRTNSASLHLTRNSDRYQSANRTICSTSLCDFTLLHSFDDKSWVFVFTEKCIKNFCSGED